jgi:uncharacterized protein YdbL (DUF1318 family)
MKQARVLVAVVMALVALASVGPSVSYGQAGGGDRMKQLRERFKERLPEMQKLRASGKVGETSTGTAEAVSGGLDKEAQKTLDAENADRAELYQIVARQQGTTAEKVARIDGIRRIKELRKGEYFKDDGGTWQQKK